MHVKYEGQGNMMTSKIMNELNLEMRQQFRWSLKHFFCAKLKNINLKSSASSLTRPIDHTNTGWRSTTSSMGGALDLLVLLPI